MPVCRKILAQRGIEPSSALFCTKKAKHFNKISKKALHFFQKNLTICMREDILSIKEAIL